MGSVKTGGQEVALARSLAQRLEQGEREITTTLRSIRDGHLGGQRLTLARRLALEDALEAAGLSVSRPPREASLDQSITITQLPSGRLQRLRAWPRHPAIQGVRGISRLAVAVIGLMGIIPLVAYFDDGEPRRMSGDLNVVAAAFQSAPAFEGQALAASVARALRPALSRDRGPAAPDVQVRGPEHLPAARDGLAARRIAERVNADVVIYGLIERRPAGTLIRPRLYVDPARVSGAEELGGDYPLLTIDAGHLPVDNAIAARSQLRAAIADHMHGLSAFTLGLGWFNAARWSRAADWFQTAQSAWPTGEQGAMVDLFRGNAAGKRLNLVRAGRAYREALRQSPDLDRARLGLTEVRLHNAQGDCERTAKARRLRAVIDRFRMLAQRGDAETLAGRALKLRARLGEARANFCLSQAELDGRWSQTIEGFQAVLRLGATDIDRFRAELAEARSGLGFAYLPPSPTAPGARVAYDRARRQYAVARDLTDDPARRAGFEQMLDFIEKRLGATGE